MLKGPQAWVVVGPIAWAEVQGRIVLIDSSDVQVAGAYRWHFSSNGYLMSVKNKSQPRKLLLHRLLMFDELTTARAEIDHINGNAWDNRRSVNLRVASSAENKYNTRAHRDSRSGYKGVRLSGRSTHRWQAMIYHSGKNYCLGSHASPEEAARAYDAKAVELFGARARLNFPKGE